jgi:hypothetical protein
LDIPIEAASSLCTMTSARKNAPSHVTVHK